MEKLVGVSMNNELFPGLKFTKGGTLGECCDRR